MISALAITFDGTNLAVAEGVKNGAIAIYDLN